MRSLIRRVRAYAIDTDVAVETFSAPERKPRKPLTKVEQKRISKAKQDFADYGYCSRCVNPLNNCRCF